MIHKTFLIALFGCVCLIQATIALEDIEAKWSEWKKQHGKQYSVKENTHRRMLFEKKVREIEKHNDEYTKGHRTYKKAINKFSDLTFDEFKQTVLNAQVPKNFAPVAEHKVDKRATLPASVDWRNEGYVTPVKNQGICGSCWAFSSVGAIEGQYYKLTGTQKQFSEQQLVDCVANNGGCNGGWTGYAFDYVRTNGIEEGTAYPYTNARLATAGTCQFDARKISDVKVNGYVAIAYDIENEPALDNALATIGPISVLVYVSENFQSYQSGIFYDDSWAGEEVNHAVLAVGYGTENGQDYYIIKNSWDTWWGEQGYIRLARNKNGHIGIGSWATYPLVSINA